MKAFFPYAASSGGVTVRVNPRYLPDESEPDAAHFVWSYHVRIENDGIRPVQLRARHWFITDGRGHIEEVAGAGVVGEQPVIAPGEAYDYVSGCPLDTPIGSMHGSYTMDRDGLPFEAEIPLFALTSPFAGAARN